MITLQENYLDLTIDEVYDIINEFDKVPWPNNFTMDKKIKFLESIREVRLLIQQKLDQMIHKTFIWFMLMMVLIISKQEKPMVLKIGQKLQKNLSVSTELI